MIVYNVKRRWFNKKTPAHFPAPSKVIDDAYVDPTIDIPDFIPRFLIRDLERRSRRTDRDDS